MSHHLAPVKVATVTHATKVKCRRCCGGKGTLLLCCWKYKLVTASLEDSALVISDVPGSKQQQGEPGNRVAVSQTRSPNHWTTEPAVRAKVPSPACLVKNEFR